MHPSFTVAIVQAPESSIMIWRSFSWSGLGPECTEGPSYHINGVFPDGTSILKDSNLPQDLFCEVQYKYINIGLVLLCQIIFFIKKTRSSLGDKKFVQTNVP